MRVVADDKIPFLEGKLEPFASVMYKPGDQISNADLLNADALLVRSITLCDKHLLENTTIRFIGSATIGDDHIDKSFCESEKINWSTAKGCNAEAVNQYVQAAILKLSGDLNVKLQSLTLAVIGVGNIGQKVCDSAQALGMKVLPYDPPRAEAEKGIQFASLEQVFNEADMISLHVPLTKSGDHKTQHMLNSWFLNAFKKPISLINSSRGAVVDTDALIAAKKSGRIKALAIDVWEHEPNLNLELLIMSNISTPHIAGYSELGKKRGTSMTIQSLSDFFNLEINEKSREDYHRRKPISFDCKNLNSNQILGNVLQLSYDIAQDSNSLKDNPAQFQELRRKYKFRYENHQYTLELSNCSKKSKEILEGLGFQL